MKTRWRTAVGSMLVAALALLVLVNSLTPLQAEIRNLRPVDRAGKEGTLLSLSEMRRESAANEEAAGSWIIKWKNGHHDERLLANSDIVSEQQAINISIVKPHQAEATVEWLETLRQSEHVEYVQPNQTVRTLNASAKPNDPLYSQQSYLRQIGADKAWAQAKGNSNITIALVDTGVDLNHPDLKHNLVKGTNLLEAGLPMDDNGHGTSVAGVLASVGNNGKGTTGVLWNAKIMPIKALDAQGYGDEDKLGAGILYAVDHGAKIVVMSVGLYRYSKYMEDIVNYAEKKGVLLVAATGNDGLRYQEKVEVKYPAAYPTVLAVGGSSPDLLVEPRSNTGPEVDLVAPWHVYTTALGGGYKAEEGTSMSAPQAAGAAALLWSKYPGLKPYQIREHLRRTAQNIESAGWDRQSGYGLLRVDEALRIPYDEQAFGTNTTRGSARVFPIDTSLSGVFAPNKRTQWFVVDAPYEGTLQLSLERIQGKGTVQATHYVGKQSAGKTYSDAGGKKTVIPVKQGLNMIRLQHQGYEGKETLSYKLSSRFFIYEDPFESNDLQYQAYTIPARTQDIVGTFGHTGDVDWYMIQLPRKGTLRLKVSVDTVRIDPALEVRGSHIRTQWIDEEKEGRSESAVLTDLPAGKYYIQVQNVVTAHPEPVAGEYKLHVEYITQYTDPNEPNDKMYEAVTMSEGTEYVGVFDKDSDVDWFQFTVKSPVYGKVALKNLPSDRNVSMTVMTKEQKKIAGAQSSAKLEQILAGAVLEPGTYYVRLTTDKKFDTKYYRLSFSTEPLVEGFRDIGAHWAQEAIVEAVRSNWISGYDEALFRPNRQITRAEAAAVLAKAFELSGSIQGAPTFTDVPAKHWAYADVSRVAKAGITGGIGNGRFGPGLPVKRAEMAVMMGKALGIKPERPAEAPFRDVPVSHWAAPMLAAMKEQGLIQGMDGDMFAPERQATRAEFVSMLVALR
ncbi:S8 family serine peptidase [Paenibacillus thiaminolyticus]|uniref:S8 family serine peptidase n=1 Tax=Paenibacillus thiaminolyticus TaxID=49283 RepID=UPI003D2AE80C